MNEESKVAALVDTEIQSRIQTIGGVQVMLDRDLAQLYGVETGQLNRQVKRNKERFPCDFMFQLTREDAENLKCQFGISSWGGDRHLPYAFTENGIAMLSSVLRSPMAIEVNIRIMRAFVAMRRTLASFAPLLTRIETAERRQIADQAKNEAAQARNEARFEQIFDAMADKKFPPQKVFFDGEFYDAFVQMKKFIRQAKTELIVIDPYFDDSCLQLLAQKRHGVLVTVVVCTRGQRNLHAVDIAQFNKQYENSLTVKVAERFHDRFLVIDRTTLIHVGASLNYLGKKCFGFSTMGSEIIPDILSRVPC